MCYNSETEQSFLAWWLCAPPWQKNIVTSNYTLAHMCFPVGVEGSCVAPVSVLCSASESQTAPYSPSMFVAWNKVLTSKKCIHMFYWSRPSFPLNHFILNQYDTNTPWNPLFVPHRQGNVKKTLANGNFPTDKGCKGSVLERPAQRTLFPPSFKSCVYLYWCHAAVAHV